MGGMLQPIPGIGPIGGRIAGDILTGGLAEAMPSGIKDPLYKGMGSVFFSPASGLAAGGAGLAAGGLGAGGFGAAAPGAGAALGTPAAGSSAIGTALGGSTPAAGGLPAIGGTPPVVPTPAGMSKSDMLQNAFLATSVGGMLGNALSPPPLPPMSVPNAPIGHGSGFTPVAAGASQQWAQLMAQRRAQQTGKFTV